MHFHSGDISHKVTCNWDSFLEGDCNERMDGLPEEQVIVSSNKGQREEAKDLPEVDGNHRGSERNVMTMSRYVGRCDEGER